MGVTISPVDAYPPETASVLLLRGKPRDELPWLCKVERSEGGSCKAGALAWPKERPNRQNCRSKSSEGRTLCRADGPGQGVESRLPMGRVVKVITTPPTKSKTSPSPQTVTEAPEQLKVTAARKTARPEKPKPKPTVAPHEAPGKPKKKAAANVKTAAAKPTKPNLVIPTQSFTFPIGEMSALLDHLPLQACGELTRRLLSSIYSHPTGVACPRSVLKTDILFVAK